jgi:hypothetical protein
MIVAGVNGPERNRRLTDQLMIEMEEVYALSDLRKVMAKLLPFCENRR